MNGHIIEQVSFRLAGGVSEEDFLRTVPATSEFIAAQPGFIRRRLSQGEDGQWMEHVEWESLEEASRASEKFMKDASVDPFMALVDEKSVSMTHTILRVSVG